MERRRLEVRDVRPSDFKGIVEVYKSFYPEAAADPSFGLTLFREPPSDKENKKWFAGVMKAIRAGNRVMKVALVESHVVGSCSVERVGPGTYVDHRGRLGIYVGKGFRGTGVGSALMKETIKACRGRFEIIELDVRATNNVAIKLYKACGFKRYGTLPDSLKRGGRYFDDDFMYLKLS